MSQTAPLAIACCRCTNSSAFVQQIIEVVLQDTPVQNDKAGFDQPVRGQLELLQREPHLQSPFGICGGTERIGTVSCGDHGSEWYLW